MNDKYSSLNSTFNVDDSIEIEKKTVKAEVEVNVMNDEQRTSKQDVQKDYEYTRGNLYSIIEKGQEAINGVLELAQETEQPRAYEVVGQLIKSVSDATEKLMDLQKKLKDIESEDKSKGPTNVTNALFIGSTAELSKLLKAQSKGEDLF